MGLDPSLYNNLTRINIYRRYGSISLDNIRSTGPLFYKMGRDFNHLEILSYFMFLFVLFLLFKNIKSVVQTM